MKLQILRLADRGQPNKERLHLSVLADTNLIYYAVLDTVYLGGLLGGISNLPKHAFWFPSLEVRAGDQVVLYTGPGQPKSEPTLVGITTHFFYWGQPQTLWNKVGDCAVLLEVAAWQTSPFE